RLLPQRSPRCPRAACVSIAGKASLIAATLVPHKEPDLSHRRREHVPFDMGQESTEETPQSGPMSLSHSHASTRENPSTPAGRNLAWRSAFSAGMPDFERLQDPLPEHVLGCSVVTSEPPDHDGSSDIRFYDGLPELEQEISGLSALRARAV